MLLCFLLGLIYAFGGKKKDCNLYQKQKKILKKKKVVRKVEIRGTKLSELSLLLDTGGAYKAEDFEEEEKEEEARELPEEDNKNK